MKTLTLLQTECVDIIYYSQFTKAANLNERVLAIRGERAQIGQVAFIKIALPLYRCQNPTIDPRREQGWRSGESAQFPPMWGGFDSQTRRHMWVEFVVGSLLCSERFFSGYSGFPLSSKTNIPRFQFDREFEGHGFIS